MPFKSYREESKLNWGRNQSEPLNIEQINCGALLRIADAVEKMAGNYTSLLADVEVKKRRIEELLADVAAQRSRIEQLRRSNAALRGVITRMRRK